MPTTKPKSRNRNHTNFEVFGVLGWYVLHIGKSLKDQGLRGIWTYHFGMISFFKIIFPLSSQSGSGVVQFVWVIAMLIPSFLRESCESLNRWDEEESSHLECGNCFQGCVPCVPRWRYPGISKNARKWWVLIWNHVDSESASIFWDIQSCTQKIIVASSLEPRRPQSLHPPRLVECSRWIGKN